MSATRDFTIVDIETTGLDPAIDTVIELCALRVRWPTWEIVGSMYRMVQPGSPVKAEARAANGYSLEAWAGAQLQWWQGDLLELRTLLAGAQWAGSAPQFDFNFIERIRVALGVPPWELRTRRLLDVGTLGTPLLLALAPESKGGQDAILDALEDAVGAIEHMGAAAEFARSVGVPDRWGRHTAIGDAFGCLWIMKHVLPPAVDYWRAVAPPPSGA